MYVCMNEWLYIYLFVCLPVCSPVCGLPEFLFISLSLSLFSLLLGSFLLRIASRHFTSLQFYSLPLTKKHGLFNCNGMSLISSLSETIRYDLIQFQLVDYIKLYTLCLVQVSKWLVASFQERHRKRYLTSSATLLWLASVILRNLHIEEIAYTHTHTH